MVTQNTTPPFFQLARGNDPLIRAKLSGIFSLLTEMSTNKTSLSVKTVHVFFYFDKGMEGTDIPLRSVIQRGLR